jgi:hypothetical protein
MIPPLTRLPDPFRNLVVAVLASDAGSDRLLEALATHAAQAIAVYGEEDRLEAVVDRIATCRAQGHRVRLLLVYGTHPSVLTDHVAVKDGVIVPASAK